MAEIIPFNAVHYDGEFAKDLNRIISPPYDVISPDEQEALYLFHPYNIIRLVLGKQFPDDSEIENRYTRAAATLRQWMETGVLKRSRDVGFTVYQMEFDQPEGGRRTVDGIVALVKVDDYGTGKVLPHEKTYKGPKEDQLNLIRACRANFTPIHGLFDDQPQEVMALYFDLLRSAPDQEAVDANGVVHRTWTLNAPAAVSKVVSTLAKKSIFIADGHHRYETSRAYKAEVIKAGAGSPDGPHEYIMMYLTAMTHPGLTILPAHRMVKGIKDLDKMKVLDELKPYFDIEDLRFSDSDREEAVRTVLDKVHSYARIGGAFGMVIQGDKSFRLLRLKDFKLTDSLMDTSVPSSLRALDVTILREIIMGRGLGLGKDESEGHIEYTPLVFEAINKALKGEVQISFLLNPTRVDQMRAAAELGHKLPQKSTYFFPKISSGLVINVF